MRRAQSLPCEAIHTHGMDLDVDEVGRWSRWLAKRTGQPPVLIGHSAGSTQILAALTRQPPASATGAILISLTYFGQGSAPYETGEDTARARVKAGDDTPELDVYSTDGCAMDSGPGGKRAQVDLD